MGEWLSATIKAIGAAVALWWGDLPALIKILMALQSADIIAGLLHAWAQRTLSSHELRKGLARKAIILLIVLVCDALDGALLHGVGAAVAGWYVAYELLSLLEHAARMGAPIPPVLTERLREVKRE